MSTEEGTHHMNATIDVRTTIPLETYKRLWAVAEHNNTSVGALVAELTRRGLTKKPAKPKNPKRPIRHGEIGRPSKYTPEMGERILEARWMHRSWADIAREEHIASGTAKQYAVLAEEERRAAIARTKTTNTEGNAA